MANTMKYKSEYHDKWAWSLALKGATDGDVAEAFGISKRTVIRWKEDHLSFAEAYQTGKDIADANVEHSLYKRAIGYEVEETETTVDIDPETGRPKPVRRRTIKKKYAPDTMACMYWLNNRRRTEWSQRQEVALSGSVKTSPMANLTEEELRALARLDEEPDGE